MKLPQRQFGSLPGSTWLLAVLGFVVAPNATMGADRTRPTTPTNLRAAAVTPTSVALAWNLSTDNSGSLSYILRELNSGQTRTLPQAQAAYTWAGMLPARTYRFRVNARDAAGNRSAPSNEIVLDSGLGC